MKPSIIKVSPYDNLIQMTKYLNDHLTSTHSLQIVHLVLGKANPHRMNGVNRVVHQLATVQKKMGMNVCVWGLAENLETNFPERPFKTHLFLQEKGKFKIPLSLKSAIKQLSKNTVIQMHGAFISEFYTISKLLKKEKIPYVFTPHGSYSKAAMKKNKWIKKVYFKLYEKHLIQNAKNIQLLGINEFEDMDLLINANNKTLIPNGLNLKDIPYFRTRPQNNELIFGFCGRVDIYHKGLDLMLKAFTKFLEKGHNATLEIIGGGEDQKGLEALAEKLGISERVIFHGKRFGQEKFDIIRRFDLFLHTSRMEGFPMAILEAAAMGIPCLSSKATNINRFIADHAAGFPYNENTPEIIALEMEKANIFYRKGTLHEKGINARKMVEQEFQWEQIAKRLYKLYSA